MKTLIEQYFYEVLGFKTAARVGRRTGAATTKQGRDVVKTGIDTAKKLRSVGVSNKAAAKTAGAMTGTALDKMKGTTASKVGQAAGVGLYGAGLVGAAYLAYKGIQKLKDKLSNSDNPQEKQNLKNQIKQKQEIVKRARAKKRG